jgi:hypothetical protein
MKIFVKASYDAFDDIERLIESKICNILGIDSVTVSISSGKNWITIWVAPDTEKWSDKIDLYKLAGKDIDNVDYTFKRQYLPRKLVKIADNYAKNEIADIIEDAGFIITEPIKSMDGLYRYKVELK